MLPWLKRDSAAARAIVVAIVLALMWRYILWRWIETLPPFGFTLDTLAALVFIVVETAALVGATISFFFLTARARPRRRGRSQHGLADLAADAAADRRLHLHLQRGGGDPRADDRRRAGDGLPQLSPVDARRRPAAVAQGAVRAPRLRLYHARRQCPRQGRQHQQRAEARRRARPAARLRLDPRRRLRADAEFPHPRDDAVPRRRRRRGADAAALRQPRPDAAQPVAGAGVARRAALFLRRHHGVARTPGTPRSAAARRRSSASRR